METLSSKKIKANKDHICNWCSLKINKGTIYSNSSHASEGTVYTWKNHLQCSELLDKIGAWDDGDGISEDGFRECVKDEYQDIMSNNYTDTYESKDFIYPNFEAQLHFVLAFYKIDL